MISLGGGISVKWKLQKILPFHQYEKNSQNRTKALRRREIVYNRARGVLKRSMRYLSVSYVVCYEQIAAFGFSVFYTVFTWTMVESIVIFEMKST